MIAHGILSRQKLESVIDSAHKLIAVNCDDENNIIYCHRYCDLLETVHWAAFIANLKRKSHFLCWKHEFEFAAFLPF